MKADNEKTWKRRSPKEQEEIARQEARLRRSPKSALLPAALFAVMTFIFWVIDMPDKGGRPPPYHVTWWHVVHIGPFRFAGIFVIFFVFWYIIQRFTGIRLNETYPDSGVLICPKCHTPQFAHDRKCSCGIDLEPLKNWKWE